MTAQAPETEAHARVKTLGRAGERPMLIGVIRIFLPLVGVGFGAGYLLRAAWPVPSLGATGVGVGCFLLAGALAWVLVRGERQFYRFWKGAQGEERVAGILADLPGVALVAHGLPVGGRAGADIDHVVVGRSGVFAVETKYWSGTVERQGEDLLVDGVAPDRPPVAQARRAATLLGEALGPVLPREIVVQPVICFVGATLARGCTGCGGVAICTPGTLPRVLQDSVEDPLTENEQQAVEAWLRKRVGAEPDGFFVPPASKENNREALL